MTTVHAPLVGDLAVVRRRSPKVQHITGPGATLCGLWSRTKLTLPGPRQASELPLCTLCQEARRGIARYGR